MARGVKGKGVQRVGHTSKTRATFKSNFYHFQEPDCKTVRSRTKKWPQTRKAGEIRQIKLWQTWARLRRREDNKEKDTGKPRKGKRQEKRRKEWRWGRKKRGGEGYYCTCKVNFLHVIASSENYHSVILIHFWCCRRRVQGGTKMISVNNNQILFFFLTSGLKLHASVI